MAQTGVHLASGVDKLITDQHQQQQQVNSSSVASQPKKQSYRNRPLRDLIAGPRENYLKIGVPLYEASIKCYWKAAKAILDNNRKLVRYSITENGETALHVAASSKADPKCVVEFVRNLVDLMEEKDLELQNENFQTVLHLAAAAGNVETVEIMVEKNRKLLAIPGAGGMLPLYAAALFGNYEVVKYLYKKSNDLCDDEWNDENRSWLLQKCVDGNMFDVALQIVKRYPHLEHVGVLLSLAEKADVFSETKGIFKRSINSVLRLIGLTMGANETKREALDLLLFVWGHISKMPRQDIDKILRGRPDLIKPWERVQALQLRKLTIKLLDKLEEETHNIIREPPIAIELDIESASGKLDHAQELEKLISEHLDNLHEQTQNLIKKGNKPVSIKKDRVLGLQNLISKDILRVHVETQNVMENTFQNKHKTKELQDLIERYIRDMRVQTMKLHDTYSFRVLFVAAEMGNTVFLVELIRGCPDLIWKVDDNRQSIFHIAVKNRHEGIYNLLYEIGSMKHMVTPLKDDNENNILHLVGKMATKKGLEDVSGPALQMQRELLWFKEVKNMIPPSYVERKNKDGLTPRELFSVEHKELMREGEKWMKETASQCMVVAALIATIVFAAAFTVPGGYNQIDGIPFFYQKKIFVAFVVADAMSLFLSSTSILVFLSILTSRYAERDFMESLPKRLMLGVLTLFLSITAMMITFSVSFFILYHKEMQWIPILIGVVALIPVVLYVVLQFHVLIDVVRSTFGSKYLFKPGKPILYYVNPRV